LVLAEKGHDPVRTMSAVLGVSSSGVDAWRGRPLSPPQVDANRALRARIRTIHTARRGRYGEAVAAAR
jgi:hypothetical protein